MPCVTDLSCTTGSMCGIAREEKEDQARNKDLGESLWWNQCHRTGRDCQRSRGEQIIIYICQLLSEIHFCGEFVWSAVADI